MSHAIYKDDKANAIVLGSILNDTMILEDAINYQINVGDFTTPLQRVVFSSINNLFVQGLIEIDATDIYRYLETSGSEGQRKIFNEENGIDYVHHCQELAGSNKLDYYYGTMKKFSLLRSLQEAGYNTRKIYDPDELDIEKINKQKQYLSKKSVEEIAQDVMEHMEDSIKTFKLSGVEDSKKGGTGIMELLDEFKETPAIGFPTYDEVLTRIMMGLQPGKYNLMSAVSGGGKTRQMAAMCAHMTATEKFNKAKGKWERTPSSVPTLFIATEQDLSEIQTLWLAHISQVNEEHILDPSMYVGDEEQRVRRAAEIIENSPFHLAELPDFDIDTIENTIRLNIQEHDVEYIFFDYINSSMSLAREMSYANIQEHQLLYHLSTSLKNLAVSYGVGIMSATQTNRSVHGTTEADSSMIKGSSAIIEKADFGAIMMHLSDTDKDNVQNLMRSTNSEGKPEPNMVFSIYKNRRSKFTNGKLWVHADLGTCTFQSIFFTDHDYNIIEVEGYDVKYDS